METEASEVGSALWGGGPTTLHGQRLETSPDVVLGFGSLAEKHVQLGVQTQSDRRTGFLSFSGDPNPAPHPTSALVRLHPETKKETSRAARLCRSDLVTARPMQ